MIWLGIAALLALVGLAVVFLVISVFIFYLARVKGRDEIYVKVSALYGLIHYKYKVHAMQFINFFRGKQQKSPA